MSLQYALPNLVTDDQEKVDLGDEKVPGSRFVNGRHQPIYLLTPGQTARIKRRDQARKERKTTRRYNRSERIKENRAAARRAQLRVLRGEVDGITPAMLANLTRALEAEVRDSERAPKVRSAVNEPLAARRAARFAAGRPRGKDLRNDSWAEFAHLLPADYAGKRSADR